MKRKYRISEMINAKSPQGQPFVLQPAEYFADTDTDGDWVAVYVDNTPVVVSRADFVRVSTLVNP